MQNKYIPVSCVLYDQLELFALRKTRIHLGFKQNDPMAFAEGIILDIYTDLDHVEYLRLSDGQTFRLDAIQTLNGEAVPNHC
ncbi:MAG: hypothetical protein SF052_12640 [Bacteroidia bacterium]|nr:hypothetical protein [Bacteroidia bacterium]